MLDTRVQLPSFSMWPKTPIYEVTVDGEPVVVFGLLQDAIVPDTTDTVFQVPRAGVNRLDLISQKAYGVPDLWHVVCSANNIIDPLVGPALGQKIQLPVKARLAREGLLSG